LGFDGTARVSDFGIAKAFGNATKSSIGVLKGSGGYMSPEQLRFEEPDRRSDLFSLGVVLYEMLAGGPLYVATPGPEAARRILTEAPPDIGELRDDVPAPLTELLFRLLAKDKDLRPSSAAEVATALEAVLVTLLQDEARLDVAGYLGRRFGARRLSQRPEVVAALETPPPSSSTTRSEPPTARRRRWLALAPLAVLAGAAATFGLWRARPLSGPRPSPTAPAAVASQVAGAAVAPARTLWAGSWHTCAKKGGSLSCWGKNNDGQLGNGQSLDSVIPASVQPEIMGVVDADGGDFHTCALDGEGQAHCFGSNLRGALGLGQQGDSLLRHEVAGTQRFIDLDAGDRHTCGVTRAGTVSCWGSNGSGQVGDGTTTDRLAPTDVPGLAVVREVSAGGDSTCALAAAGLYCWGAPLREGANSASSPRPVLVAGAGDVSQVSVGRGFACLRRPDGKVACWGANAYGQLGDGTNVGRASPRDVAGDDRFVHVSAGGSFACALQADGRVRCWGRNHWGNLGTGSDEDLAVPTLVVDLATVTEVAAGRVHACARLRGGGVACWGHNDTGQVGDGTRGKDRLRPVTVPGPD
jgi:alpha-tubulin suppressor-like RCC1 family protein